MSGKILAPVIHDVIVSKTPDQGGGSGIRVKGKIQHHRGQIFSAEEMGGGGSLDEDDDAYRYHDDGGGDGQGLIGYGGMADGYREDEDEDGGGVEDDLDEEEDQRYRHRKGGRRHEEDEVDTSNLPPRKKLGRPRGRPPKKNITATITTTPMITGGKTHLSRLATLIASSKKKKKGKDSDDEDDGEEESFDYYDDDTSFANGEASNDDDVGEAAGFAKSLTVSQTRDSNRPQQQSNGVSLVPAAAPVLTADGLQAKLTTRVEMILTRLLSISCQRKAWQLQLKTIEGQVRTRVQNEIRTCNGSKKGRVSEERRRQI
ncbi:MAG TPA: hypothetical protein VKE92_11565, partial [Anaerolineales bacterium]|nr:hypothetical protein [Anaerolineales bacterium]